MRWEHREPPLPPAAVAGLGPAATALAAAARDRLAAGATLRAAAAGTGAGAGAGAAGDEPVLVVLGDPADLPWADGVRYLGWDDGVLVPTTARPLPSPALWRDALASAAERPLAEPLLVLLPPGLALLTELPVRPAAFATPAPTVPEPAP
nr:hypothetical protein [Kitasatospora sp. SID7827]